MSHRVMPSSQALDPESETLKAALRAVRRHRALRVRDVAQAMGLPLRTYQHFESGRSQLDWPRIKAFAAATDSDPHGILAAVVLRSPDFAVRCMDNKLASVLVVALRRFDDRLGDRLARIEVGRLIAAFRRTFDELEAELLARDAEAEAWLSSTQDDA